MENQTSDIGSSTGTKQMITKCNIKNIRNIRNIRNSVKNNKINELFYGSVRVDALSGVPDTKH